jgi:hypothetical protein
VENISTLVKRVLTDGSTLMIAGGMDLFPISALALIVVILAARIVMRKRCSMSQLFRARRTLINNRATGGFEAKHSPELKPCPNCAEQVPLLALICDACDYNFLAARPGRGQKLLPTPEPMTQKAVNQSLESAEALT